MFGQLKGSVIEEVLIQMSPRIKYQITNQVSDKLNLITFVLNADMVFSNPCKKGMIKVDFHKANFNAVWRGKVIDAERGVACLTWYIVGSSRRICVNKNLSLCLERRHKLYAQLREQMHFVAS